MTLKLMVTPVRTGEAAQNKTGELTMTPTECRLLAANFA